MGHGDHVGGVGDAEVGQFYHAAGVQSGQQQVVGLDVVVGDAASVDARRFEREGGLMGYGDGQGYVQRSPVYEFLGGVWNVFHGDEVGAFALADLCNAHDVRMSYGRDYPGFTSKTPDYIGVGRQVRMQYLERHLSVEAGIVGAIDRTPGCRRPGR